jgi:hypothetical protein
MLSKRQAGATRLVRAAALVGGLAALSGAGASVLATLDVIRVEWDYKWPVCAIAAAICLAFLVVCAWAWRLRSGAILLLCSGYLLVGFVAGLNCALALMLRFPAVGHERQVYVATFAALVSFITGIVVHRQIAVLKGAC